MKKLLLITDYFRPEPGGLEGFLTGIARLWPKECLETLVTIPEKEYLTKREVRLKFDAAEKYPIYRLPVYSTEKGGRSDSKALENFLAERLDYFAPSHVLFAQLTPTTRKIIRFLENQKIDCSLLLNGSDLKKQAGFRKQSYISHKMRYIFAPSRHLARAARTAGITDEKIVLMPSGMELRPGLRRKVQLPARLEERWNNKLLVIGAGSMLPRKGFNVAIEMLAAWPELTGKLHLVLVGSGPEYYYLQELIRLKGLEEHVTMTGFLRDEYLAALMRKADIFIQPGSRDNAIQEGLGAALMEAALFGVPALVGDSHGLDEIVRNDVSGYVVPAGNRDELSEKIGEMIASHKLRRRLGKNAAELARREFSLNGALRLLYRLV